MATARSVARRALDTAIKDGATLAEAEAAAALAFAAQVKRIRRGKRTHRDILRDIVEPLAGVAGSIRVDKPPRA